MTAEAAPHVGNDRLAEVTREAFATTRKQRAIELRHVAVHEAVAMLVDGCPVEDVTAYMLDSVLGEQAGVAGIRVPASFRVECACGYGTPGLSLAEADVIEAQHADAECVPEIVLLDGTGRRLP